MLFQLTYLRGPFTDQSRRFTALKLEKGVTIPKFRRHIQINLNLNDLPMFSNIIKVAFRNLFRHSGYTFINVLGLAIGLTSSIFIFLYVINELSYDKFHEKSDRIYRAWILGNMPGTEMRHAVTSPPMMEALLQDYPEVENAVRLYGSGNILIRKGDRIFYETDNNFLWADSTFFDVFRKNRAAWF